MSQREATPPACTVHRLDTCTDTETAAGSRYATGFDVVSGAKYRDCLYFISTHPFPSVYSKSAMVGASAGCSSSSRSVARKHSGLEYFFPNSTVQLPMEGLRKVSTSLLEIFCPFAALLPSLFICSGPVNRSIFFFSPGAHKVRSTEKISSKNIFFPINRERSHA